MRDLAASLGRLSASVTICAAHCGRRNRIDGFFAPPTRWITAPGLWMGKLSWAPALKSILEAEISRADVVHNHTLWMLPTSYASRIAKRKGKPVVFTAHGSLEPWALRHSGWKKRLTGFAFQNRDLEESACIHVLTAGEGRSVRAYGIRNPIAVIPNGVDLLPFDALPSRSAFDVEHPHLAGKRICLFLSRLHRKKGLGHLIPAWERVSRKFPEWHLVVAGPDDGYEAIVQRMISDRGLDGRITLVGPLNGERKFAALAAASLFVLPSFSEGFSMAILEAMAARLPVLITSACNFPEVDEIGCGLEVAPNVEDTACGLMQILEATEFERKQMGEKGRALVESRYTWDHATRDMILVSSGDPFSRDTAHVHATRLNDASIR